MAGTAPGRACSPCAPPTATARTTIGDRSDRSAAGRRAWSTTPTQPGFVVARIVLGSSQIGPSGTRKPSPLLADGWPARPAAAADLRRAAVRRPVPLALLQLGEVERPRAGAGRGRTSCRREERVGRGRRRVRGLVPTGRGPAATGDGDLRAAQPALRRAAELGRAWGRDPDQVAALTSLAEAELAGGDGRTPGPR